MKLQHLVWLAALACAPGCTGTAATYKTPDGVDFGILSGTLLSDRKIDGVAYKVTTTTAPDGTVTVTREFGVNSVDSKAAAAAELLKALAK